MSKRRGLTLVELLMVIGVASLLLAAAIPLLRLSLQDRKIREAARQVNAFMARAKARAAELGRPVGVLIRRADPAFANGSFYSQQLFLAESPPPYAGDDSFADAQIPSPTDANMDGVPDFGPYSAQLRSSALAMLLVSPGDLIQFEFHQPLYEITALSQPDPSNQPDVVDVVFAPLRPPTPAPPPPPTVNRRIPFQIYRSPIQLGAISATGQSVIRASGAPLDLPNGVVIDLTVSGMEPTLNQFTAADPNDLDTWTPSTVPDPTDVVIMFAPDGSVARVYHGVYVPVGGTPVLKTVGRDPSGMIFLLLGRLDQVQPSDPFARGPDVVANLMDTRNFWIAISPQTGRVITAENASLESILPPPPAAVPPALKPTLLKAAREFALSPQETGA
ncbi:MAG: hypothetical protein KatS3mg110_4000 [Pirellulaceae bacterium]|nr:MAG: hypothetical protein KatS3mg110_4000 [Pirellulaceae bacterium]